MQSKISDTEAMSRCLELALNGSGSVSPNPLVGSVIINDGVIISEAWHEEYGGLHAEINAIKKSGLSSFEGMTLAVNLEPCSHFGKQAPCVDTIIEKKFSRVIIGMKDPNPLVSGNGIEKLKKAGIAVEVGILEKDCKWINRFFCKKMGTNFPFIVMKVAQSLDGCIATITGESKWITCEESRRRTHILRHECDAILVGINTVLEDNPILDTRHIGNIKLPTVIILDTNLRFPLNSNLALSSTKRKVIVVHSSDNKERIEELASANINLIYVENMFDLKNILELIATQENLISVLVEGGSHIFSSFVSSNLIDELHLFVAPIIIGNGKRTFSAVETLKLSESYKLRFLGSTKSGTDEHIFLMK